MSLLALHGTRYTLEPGYPGDRETERYIMVFEEGTGFFGFVRIEGKREIPESLWTRIRKIGADRFVERAMAGRYERSGIEFLIHNADPDLDNYWEKLAEEQERLGEWLAAFGNQLCLWNEGLPW